MRIRLILLAAVVALLTACQPRVPVPRFDPRDTNRDGYVDCQEDPKPDPVTDLPCGFRDGVPVGG